MKTYQNNIESACISASFHLGRCLGQYNYLNPATYYWNACDKL